MKDTFSFELTKELTDRFPGVKIAAILLSGLQLKKTVGDIAQIHKNVLEDLAVLGEKVFESTEFTSWNKVFEKLGLGKDFQPAHISLLKRAIKAKQLPRINTLVDLYNAISVSNRLPVGGHDLKDRDTIFVGRTRGGEKYKAINGTAEESIPEGEFAYLDTAGKVLTRNLVWRQSEYSSISDASTDVFVPIDDFTGQRSFTALESVAMELLALISLFYDFKCDFGVVSRFNTRISLKPTNLSSSKNISYLTAARPDVDTSETVISKFFDRKLDLIYPSKDELEKALKSGRRLKFYIGVDATGPKLHLGHIIPVMKMAELQKMGHRVIFLIGDFTARIGDPTDRSAARVMLSEEEISTNIKLFKEQIAPYVDFDLDTNPAQLVTNSTWNSDLTLSSLIDLASNFTVQQMLERDMFQLRLKENKPVYLHEFLYPLIQGFDSVAMQVDGEFGGRDQTFNMLAGRTLSKNLKNIDKFVITTHFLLSADGVTKMSKSIGNCIFINDSAQDKYAKVMAIPDNLIIHYYQLATNLSDADIAKIQEDIDKGTDPMQLKKTLAQTITAMHNGEDQAAKAASFFERTVQNNEAPDEIAEFKRAGLGTEIETKDLLLAAKLAPSASEAKRLIRSGAVEFDGKKIEDPSSKINPADVSVIKVGKKKWLKLTD